MAEARLAPRQRMRALVLSPTASHPADYGNRNRVFQTTQFLQDRGYEISFVLYPIEDDWATAVPPSAAAMQAHWGNLHVIPPSRPLHQLAAGEFHTIDEWWDPAIGDYLAWLFARQFFDVVFVNYPFLSRAFELAPKHSVKVLDTHDLFSGRKEMLAAAGVPPEFFYTTAEQERIAFDRADVVIAIKDSEQAYIQGVTERDVVSVPFYPSASVQRAPPQPYPDPLGRLRVGFIGALNSVNAVNMQSFLKHYERIERLYSPPIRIMIAGRVCDVLYARSETVELLGRVETVEAFYDQIDVVVAPLLFSTGIKIKIGEALSFGKPVLATQNAIDGFPVLDEYQSLPDMAALGQALMRLAFDPARLAMLRDRSRLSAKLAEQRAGSGFDSLGGAMVRQTRRIVFITDRPFWKQRDIRDARLHQWVELSTYLLHTTIIDIGAIRHRSKPVGVRYEHMPLISEDVITDALAMLFAMEAATGQLELVVATDGVTGPVLLTGLAQSISRIWVDLWNEQSRVWVCERSPRPPSDIAVIQRNHLTLLINTTALRYLPPFVEIEMQRINEFGPLNVEDSNLWSSFRFSIGVDWHPRISFVETKSGISKSFSNSFFQDFIRTYSRGFSCRDLWKFTSICESLCRTLNLENLNILHSEIDLHYQSLGCNESSDTGWSTYWRIISEVTHSL